MLLTFDFKSIEEAQEFLADLKGKPMRAVVLNPEAVATVGPSKPFGVVGAEILAASLDATARLEATPSKLRQVIDPAPKKPGRPKKAAAPTPEPAKEYTIDDCRTALSQLFDKKGREAAKRALEGYQVARIGELTAPVYAQFIETCANLSK